MKTTYAILAGFGYGGYMFLISQASRYGVPVSVIAMTLQVTAAIGGMIIYQLSPKTPVQQMSVVGLLLAVAAGLSVQMAEFFSVKAYAMGLSTTAGALIVVGMQAIVPAILGVFFLKESLSPNQLIGVGIILVGVMWFSLSK